MLIRARSRGWEEEGVGSLAFLFGFVFFIFPYPLAITEYIC